MIRFLSACRFLLLIPVIGCILLTLGVIVMGMGRIFTVGMTLLHTSDFTAKVAKTMSLEVIEIVDLFLIGTVAYITAMGMYKLFISDKEISLPTYLKIESLKDLEDKIIGVIVAALAVAFLGQVTATDEIEAILNYGGGIAMVIISLAFFTRQNSKGDSEKGKK